MSIAAFILVCALASRLLDGRWLSAPLVLSTSLLLPLLVFPIEVAPFTILLLMSAAACFAIGYYTLVFLRLKRSRYDDPTYAVDVPTRELTVVAGSLFAIAQTAFAINVLRVLSQLGPTAYTSASSKAIELTFGASSLVNYLFFLNIAAACLGAYLIGSGRASWRMVLMVLWGVACLGFTGIKSTMIFGGCMVTLVYVLVRRPSVGWVAAAGVLGALVVMGLFIGVNIGPAALLELKLDTALADRVLMIVQGYILNNYLNLDLELGQRDTWAYGKYTFFFISKLLDPKLAGYYDVQDFLVVDRAFNMGTLLREYFVDFGVPGALLIPFILGGLTALVSGAWQTRRMPRHSIILAVLLTACMFAFFGNQFVRLQFLYVIAAAYAADFLASVLARGVARYADPTRGRAEQCAE